MKNVVAKKKKRKLGINFVIAPSLSVSDGIDAVRRKLPRCWFDQKRCSSGLKALRSYRREWRQEFNVYAAHPRHDWTSHGADSFRYAATGFRPAMDMSNAPRKARTDYDMWNQ